MTRLCLISGGWLLAGAIPWLVPVVADQCASCGSLTLVSVAQSVAHTPSARVIFAQNVFVLLALALGGVAFGIPTALILMKIGSDLSHLLIRAWRGDVPIAVIVSGIATHGILELAAMCLAAACGFWLAGLLYSVARSGASHSVPQVTPRQALYTSLSSMVLLVVASTIEA